MIKSVASKVMLAVIIVVVTSAVSIALRLYCLARRLAPWTGGQTEA